MKPQKEKRMEEELSVSTQETVEDTNNYIEAIKEMKQNSVSKSEYEKLKEENKQLLQSLVNGERIDLPVEEPVDINELRSKLLNTDGDMLNLEYITTALKLRDEVMSKGGNDPFVPFGTNYTPTDEDINAANKVANVLQECVDIADGNSGIFTNELQRRLVDTPIRR